jgi:ribonuclease BN (tRNA processing enzyme)
VRHIVLSHRHLDHVGGLEPLLWYVFYEAYRTGAPPPPIDLHELPGSAAAIRAALTAADASADRAFGERLTWRTPKAGERVTVDGGAALTLVPVDHLPPNGEAAGCVVSAGGVRIVYSGDTRPCDALVDAARGADLLVHEVGGTDARAELLHRVGHSTAADAGGIAARAGVRALAMFHTPAPVWVSPEDLLSEARRAAPGVEVFLAEDGQALTL